MGKPRNRIGIGPMLSPEEIEWARQREMWKDWQEQCDVADKAELDVLIERILTHIPETKDD